MTNNELNNFRWVYAECLASSACPKNAAQIEQAFYFQGIRSIISFSSISRFPGVLHAIESLGILHSSISFEDGMAPDRNQADEFVLRVDECLAGSLPTLCHCKEGFGRTSTMLIYYFMTRFGYSLAEAQTKVPNATLTSEQISFLYDYSVELAGKLTGDQMLSEALISEYNALNLDQSRALITGSGPLAIRGIRRANDIDVLVTDGYYQELLGRFGSFEVKPGKMVIGNVDICNGLGGECDFMDSAMANGQKINNMNFMALPDVIRLKMRRRLPKDFADIVMIQHYLRKNAII